MSNTYVIRDRMHWADFLPWYEGWQMKAQIRMEIGLERSAWYGSPTPRGGLRYFFPINDGGAQKRQFDETLMSVAPKGILEQIRAGAHTVNWPPDPSSILKQFQ